MEYVKKPMAEGYVSLYFILVKNILHDVNYFAKENKQNNKYNQMV